MAGKKDNNKDAQEADNKFSDKRLRDLIDCRIEIREPIVKRIAEIADKYNFSVFIVGGYVRDYYLERPDTDFDFTVVGDSIAFAKIVAKAFKTKPVIYPRFRTALVPIAGSNCEFVGTRKEEYVPDSRNPIVTEGSLEDDLKRRDFTINAMAASIATKDLGKVIDLFNGREDLIKGIIRTPLEPETTFSDDPLRMLRAIRFSAQLNFEIEKKCMNAIKKMTNRLEIISQERITDEFMKLLQSGNPGKGIRGLYDTGLLEIVFPELHKLAGIEVRHDGDKRYAHKDVLIHSIKVLDNIARKSDNVWLRFAALVHDIAKSITKKFIPGTGWSFHGHEELGARHMEKIFRRMKMPLDKLDYVQRLVRLHQRPMALVDDEVTDSAVRRLAFQAGDALEDLFTLCRSDITTNNPRLSKKYLENYEKVFHKVMYVQEKDKLREFQSPLRGDEIMKECNINPSPAVGIIKSKIEDAILDGLIPNEYEAAKEYFNKNKELWLAEIGTAEFRN